MLPRQCGREWLNRAIFSTSHNIYFANFGCRAPTTNMKSNVYVILLAMTNVLKKAIASVTALPEEAQEQIGEELLLHVAKLRRLRTTIDQGLRSLDRCGGREIDIEDVIKRARKRYGAA
jgi:hypothetical protein